MATIGMEIPQSFQRQWECALAEEPTLVDHRLKAIEDGLTRLTGAFERLTRIEERHQETREALGRIVDSFTKKTDDHESRIRAIQSQIPHNHLEDHEKIPTAVLGSKWTISGVLGVVGLVGVAAIKIILAGGAIVAN